jgi:hypothetical protein
VKGAVGIGNGESLQVILMGVAEKEGESLMLFAPEIVHFKVGIQWL